jgi:hypothetical protein
LVEQACQLIPTGPDLGQLYGQVWLEAGASSSLVPFASCLLSEALPASPTRSDEDWCDKPEKDITWVEDPRCSTPITELLRPRLTRGLSLRGELPATPMFVRSVELRRCELIWPPTLTTLTRLTERGCESCKNDQKHVPTGTAWVGFVCDAGSLSQGRRGGRGGRRRRARGRPRRWLSLLRCRQGVDLFNVGAGTASVQHCVLCNFGQREAHVPTGALFDHVRVRWILVWSG